MTKYIVYGTKEGCMYAGGDTAAVVNTETNRVAIISRKYYEATGAEDARLFIKEQGFECYGIDPIGHVYYPGGVALADCIEDGSVEIIDEFEV